MYAFIKICMYLFILKYSYKYISVFQYEHKMVLPHQASTSKICHVQWKCQDCPLKRQWLWTLSKRPITVNGVWWQFSLRKNEDITSTWLLQLTATSHITAIDHFISCCSLEPNHPHLRCTSLPTVLFLKGDIHSWGKYEGKYPTNCDGTCCWPELTEFKLYRNSSHSLWVNHSKWQCCISKVIHQTQIQKLGGFFRVQ